MGSYVLSTNNAAPFSMEEGQQVIYFFIFSAILPALTPVDQTEHQIQFQEHHDPSNEPSRPGLIIIRKSTPNCSASNSFVPRLILIVLPTLANAILDRIIHFAYRFLR